MTDDLWVRSRNIAHYTEMLAAEKDPEKRRVIEMLLAHEQEEPTAGTVKAAQGA